MTAPRLADGVAVTVFMVTFAIAVGIIAVDPAAAAPDRIEIRIRYSHFEPSALVVSSGRPVTFVVRNDDPIEHEWIVGDDALHDRHRTGTEPHHGSRPTEISIPPLSTVETTVVFDGPITWQYICHLPGHEAYGMVGRLDAR